MAKVIVMPKLGYTQDSGAIAAWLKNEGDTVERGKLFSMFIQIKQSLP